MTCGVCSCFTLLRRPHLLRMPPVAPKFTLMPVVFAGVDEPQHEPQHEPQQGAAETSLPEELQECTSSTYSIEEVLARLPPDDFIEFEEVTALEVTQLYASLLQLAEWKCAYQTPHLHCLVNP
jgi:hypothetical protein